MVGFSFLFLLFHFPSHLPPHSLLSSSRKLFTVWRRRQEIERGSEWEENSIPLRTVWGGGGMPTCSGREDVGGPGSMGGIGWSQEKGSKSSAGLWLSMKEADRHPQSMLNLRMWVGGDGQG